MWTDHIGLFFNKYKGTFGGKLILVEHKFFKKKKKKKKTCVLKLFAPTISAMVVIISASYQINKAIR